MSIDKDFNIGALIRPANRDEWPSTVGTIFANREGELTIYWFDCGPEPLSLYDDDEIEVISDSPKE